MKPAKEPVSTEGWRDITKRDIPSRVFFAEETVCWLEEGQTNSDVIRNKICKKLRLIWKKPSNQASEDPTDEFVNEHAFALKILNSFRIVELIDPEVAKEYRLLPGAREQLKTLEVQAKLYRVRDKDRDPDTGRLPDSPNESAS